MYRLFLFKRWAAFLTFVYVGLIDCRCSNSELWSVHL